MMSSSSRWRSSDSVSRCAFANLARERVVELRQRLALHVLHRDADGLGLRSLRLVGEIVRPFDGPLDRLALTRFHDQLFNARDRLSGAEHEGVLLALRHRARFVRRRKHDGDHVTLGRPVLDRRPRRPLLAQLLDLFADLFVGDLSFRARHAESLRSR
jgi:hypothetical protein